MKTYARSAGFLWVAITGLVSSASPILAQDFWLEGGPVVRGGFHVKVSGSS